jgi:hypothetical protein
MNCCGQIVLVEEALLAPFGEEYDRCARRSVSLEQVRDRSFVIAVTNFDQPYSFMSAQRAIEAEFLGCYVDEQYAEAEAGTDEQDSPEHRNRATHLAHYAHQAHIGAEGWNLGLTCPFATSHRCRADNAQNTQSDGIRRACKVAHAAFEKERLVVRTASVFLQEGKAAQAGLEGAAVIRGAAAAKIGKAAVRLETELRESSLGSKLLIIGKITASKPFVRGLVVFGAAVEGVASYVDSTAEIPAGKVANAALGAGAGALGMAKPVVASADMVAPDGYKLSVLYHGTAADQYPKRSR